MDGDNQARSATISAIAESLVSLGSEFRQVRKARRMTLKALASASGVSISHLSAIERGAANPSIETVYAIADGLGVAADWFFARRPGAGPMERAYVVRRQNRRNLNMLYGEEKEEIGYTDALVSSSVGGQFYMGVADYEPHSSRPGHPMYQHGGEQHGLILHGELELQIGDELITLREGDSYSFPASIIHNAFNKTDRPCRLVWAVSPVIIPRDVVVEVDDEHTAPIEAQSTARKRRAQ